MQDRPLYLVPMHTIFAENQSVPHTLIGLGPFANLGCSIVFTKTAVNVIDPNGHSILKGWWEQDGPRLWRFPLKANKPSLPLPALPHVPNACPPAARPPLVVPLPTTSPQPSVAPPVHHLHPSKGIQIINAKREACSIFYLYGATQAMVMAAQLSSIAFNPHSMDLPSIGTLVGFYHACLGFLVKQTWLKASKAGNCNSFDGLSYSNVA